MRQCERLSRLLRVLHLISGKGRWDATTLAEELGCSRRTIYRLLQTLSLAGVPWHFDEVSKAYRVRPGFKFSMIDQPGASNHLATDLAPAVEKLIAEGEAFVGALQKFLSTLQQSRR